MKFEKTRQHVTFSQTSVFEGTETAGLFRSGKTKWFKHGGYKIADQNGNLYLEPTSPTITIYDPFENGEQLLTDFYELALSLESNRNNPLFSLASMALGLIETQGQSEKNLNFVSYISNIKNVPWVGSKILFHFMAQEALTEEFSELKQILSEGLSEMERIERADAERSRSFFSHYGPLGLLSRYGELFQQDGKTWIKRQRDKEEKEKKESNSKQKESKFKNTDFPKAQTGNSKPKTPRKRA